MQNKSGSISVFFLIFAVIMLGFISYSLYIGRSVKQKIDQENAADMTAYSAATHAANGLNMIATNNLAIGASLHIAAATPILARYKAILQAAMTTSTKYDDILKLNTDPDGSPYASWYQYTRLLGGLYVQTAAGLTSVNVKIKDFWPLGALGKSLEQMRSNSPGSIGLPMRTLHPVGSTVNPVDFFKYDFPHMELTSPKRTMCQSVLASEVIGERRHKAVFWLGAPFGASHVGTGVLNGLETVETAARTLGNAIKIFLSPAETALDVLYHTTGCSWIRPRPKVCKQIRKFRNAIRVTIPVPEFEKCGQNYEGDFSQMIDKFIDHADAPADAIGFLFPNVKTPQEKEEFEKGIEFAILMGQPQWLSRELPQKSLAAGGTIGVCPVEWRYTYKTRTYCSIIMGGADSMTFRSHKNDDSFSAASGGLSASFAQQSNLINPGGLASVWKRVQWSVGQARVVYRPNRDQKDPDAVDISNLNPSIRMPDIIDRMRMQTFWPAWKAELTPSTISEAILEHLRG